MSDLIKVLPRLFSELTLGANHPRGSFVLNSGDAGLLQSLERLTATEASQSVHGGATIAAHAQHVQYGLMLMNRWARDGGNPFADATWDLAWKTGAVTEEQWRALRAELRHEAEEWLSVLATPREASTVELCGMIGSVAHVAYHLGAIRQIAVGAREPTEGTFGAGEGQG